MRLRPELRVSLVPVLRQSAVSPAMRSGNKLVRMMG